MQSQSTIPSSGFKDRLKALGVEKWEGLSENQRKYAKKAFKVLTYKWRWQIAMNIPYLAIFVLDRSIPAVHEFNVSLLNSIVARLPIPDFLVNIIG